MLIRDSFFYKDNVTSTIVKFLLEEDQRNNEKMLNKNFSYNLFHWFNDNITRLMTYKQAVQYAIFAAELVLPIFEKKHPNDKKLRKAIEAAKKCIDDPSEENKKATRYVNNIYSITSNVNSVIYYAVTTSYTSHTSHNPDTYYAYAAANSATINKINKDKIIQYGLDLLYKE